MKVIGLAGRAGSGKSAVARWLAQRSGIEWVDLDRLAWETYAPGTATYERLIEAFGDDIVAPSGQIDRAQLSQRAFADDASLETLNRIVHPAVSEAVKEVVRRHRLQGTELLLLEGALIASSPHVDRSTYDVVVWLEVPSGVRADRLRLSGRPDHAQRGEVVSPQPPVRTVSGEGTIEQVGERLLAAVSGSDA